MAVMWTDGSTNEASFQLQRCTGAGCSAFTNLIKVASTTGAETGGAYMHTDAVAAGTTYCYRLAACTAAGVCGTTSAPLCGVGL